MTHANWFEPEMIQALGWTLLHFVWQGAALALLFSVTAAFCAGAKTRYAAAVSTLILMAACPIATFVFLQHRGGPFDVSAIKEAVRGVQAAVGSPTAFSSEAVADHGASLSWLQWCVAVWFAGVVAFGLRALGGCIVIERLRREKIEPLSENVRRMCSTLQQRLCVRQSVQYFQSRVVDSPAVIGWFRPVVLLPLTALTGLSPQQLEAVILHELAHIKRWDSFVNLFQISVETILFYHPAVWWVSRSIRTERENCCDDIAVSICGNAGDYARALALLESWRATPALAMAVTGGALKARIARLIGFEKLSAGVPRAGLAAVGLICAGSALLAASEFRGVYFDAADSDSSVTEPTKATVPEVTTKGWPRAEAKNVDRAEIAQEPAPPQAPEPASTSAPHTDRISKICTRRDWRILAWTN